RPARGGGLRGRRAAPPPGGARPDRGACRAGAHRGPDAGRGETPVRAHRVRRLGRAGGDGCGGGAARGRAGGAGRARARTPAPARGRGAGRPEPRTRSRAARAGSGAPHGRRRRGERPGEEGRRTGTATAERWAGTAVPPWAQATVDGALREPTDRGAVVEAARAAGVDPRLADGLVACVTAGPDPDAPAELVEAARAL